jgi:trehalose 6-phosphate phosphatase
VFLDFDGTLAPIVSDPAAARPLPGAVDVLGALARRLGRVAVLSGRPVSYLAAHLAGAPGVSLLGLYGMERGLAGTPGVWVDGRAARWRAVVDEAVSASAGRVPPGVEVEPKGLSVTFHYRRVPEAEEGVRSLGRSLSEATGLVASPGKMSVELRPPVAVDKGSVLSELGVGLEFALFAGDDAGDLPAFSALAGLRRAGCSTLGVAVAGAETPAAVLDGADVVVDGPPGVVAILSRLR